MWGKLKRFTQTAIDLRTTSALPSGSVGVKLPTQAGASFDRYWMTVGFNGGTTPTVDVIPFLLIPTMPITPIDTRWVSMTKIAGIPAPAGATASASQYIELTPAIMPGASRLYIRQTAIADSAASHDLPDSTNDVTSAAATDLSTSIALANEAKADYNAHDTDATPTWHFATGGSYQVTAADATDLTTLVTLCLDIQTEYPNHIGDATMHTPADTTNTLGAVTITDLPTCQTFLNDFKAKYNAHLVFAGPENVWVMLFAAEEVK